MPADRKKGRTREGEFQVFTLRLPADLHRQLRHYALDQEVSLNELVARVLDEWWQTQPERAVYAKLTKSP